MTMPKTLILFLGMTFFASLASAADHDKTVDPDIAAQAKCAQIQKLINETLIDTKGLQEEMPLAKFLVALQKKLPKGKEISVRIDEEAFGAGLPKVADANVEMAFPERVSLASVLRQALDQVATVEEVDYGILPTGVVITRPQRAAHLMVYNVRDIVERIPLLLPELKQGSERYEELLRDLKSKDGPAALVHLAVNQAGLQSWENIQVLNANRLALFASPTRHYEVANLLEMLRELADVAVVMNARLYEVDLAFFTREIAPLFSQEKATEERPLVVAIDEALFKTIVRHKELLRSENNKITPGQLTHFLSQQSAFRYGTVPNPAKKGQMLTKTGLTGVSFQVKSMVSLDRRYLRLQVSQQVTQLVDIGKIKILDVLPGKEMEVESPNLRNSLVTGTVQIADRAPILMLVVNRPSGKANEHKVWLLVARPFIWMDEEVKDIRREGGKLSPQSVWDSQVPKEERPVERAPLPLNDEVKEILQAVITDILTNPDLRSSREFYGTEKDKTLSLVNDEKVSWPKEFKPETHGYKLVTVKNDPFVNPRRVLGIRLDKFDLKEKKMDLFNAPIEITLSNAGGSANGAVIGGCFVAYVPTRVGNRWIVQCVGMLDP